MTRLLCITHDASTFGAARSLRGLIQACPDFEVDLMVPVARTIFDLEGIRRFFGVRRVLTAHLPYEFCFPGHPRALLFRTVLPVVWRATRGRFYERLHRARYDAIHLNSIVLHEVVRPDLPFLLHVREILTGCEAAVRGSAERARGVIFIDEATRAPFAGCRLQHATVLNNPIDMSGVPTAQLPDARTRLGCDPWQSTIFVMVGTISRSKGNELVIRAFRQLRAPDARLVLVGHGLDGYDRSCRALAKDDPRVVFWGDEPDIERIYAVADYVIRGEAYPCVGRTMYEGLYAGCGVIVPALPAHRGMFFDVDRFSEQIHFYAPGDEAALMGTLTSLLSTKRVRRNGLSNLPEYGQQFMTFLSTLTERAERAT